MKFVFGVLCIGVGLLLARYGYRLLKLRNDAFTKGRYDLPPDKLNKLAIAYGVHALLTGGGFLLVPVGGLLLQTNVQDWAKPIILFFFVGLIWRKLYEFKNGLPLF